MLPNWKQQYKTEDEAWINIFDLLAENKGAMNEEGVLRLFWKNRIVTLSYAKKK